MSVKITGRPKTPRKTCGRPLCSCFKPDRYRPGTCLGVDLAPDEFEAIKLHDVDELDQNKASKKMGISQSTFARILQSAHKKLAVAPVEGREIRIG